MALQPLTTSLQQDDDTPTLRMSRVYNAMPLEWLPHEDDEEWAYLAGRDDYAISTHGRFARTTMGTNSHPGRILKPQFHTGDIVRSWVPHYGFRTNGHFIRASASRLIYEAFIGPIPEGMAAIATQDGNLRPQTLQLEAVHYKDRADKEKVRASYQKMATTRLKDGTLPLVVALPQEVAIWVHENGGTTFVRDQLIAAHARVIAGARNKS